MGLDKTKVLTGPINVRLMAGATEVAAINGLEYEAVKFKSARQEGSKKLKDGSTDKWFTGLDGDGSVEWDEWDETVIDAIETARTTIDAVEIDFLNKGKTATLQVDTLSVEQDGFCPVVKWVKSLGSDAKITDIMSVEATA